MAQSEAAAARLRRIRPAMGWSSDVTVGQAAPFLVYRGPLSRVQTMAWPVYLRVSARPGHAEAGAGSAAPLSPAEGGGGEGRLGSALPACPGLTCDAHRSRERIQAGDRARSSTPKARYPAPGERGGVLMRGAASGGGGVLMRGGLAGAAGW